MVKLSVYLNRHVFVKLEIFVVGGREDMGYTFHRLLTQCRIIWYLLSAYVPKAHFDMTRLKYFIDNQLIDFYLKLQSLIYLHILLSLASASYKFSVQINNVTNIVSIDVKTAPR